MFGLLYDLGVSIYSTFSNVWDWLFIELRMFFPFLTIPEDAVITGWVDQLFVDFMAMINNTFSDFIDGQYLVFRPIDCFLGMIIVLLVYRMIKWFLDIVL